MMCVHNYVIYYEQEEYDNYLAYLLDRHLTRQKNLSDQVEEISRKGDAVSVAMEDAIKTVDNLEDLARKELQMNEKYFIAYF